MMMYSDIESKEDAFKHIKKWPWAIIDIPEKFINEELLVEAIKGSRYSIKHIPNRLLTEKLKLLHQALWEL